MHKQRSFPLRIGGRDRVRAQKLAEEIGISENRLYAEIIQEGLLIREQMAYIKKLCQMPVAAAEMLALLDKAPDTPPPAWDALPEGWPKPKRRAAAKSQSRTIRK